MTARFPRALPALLPRGGGVGRLGRTLLVLGLCGAALAPVPARAVEAPQVGAQEPPVAPEPPLPERPEEMVRTLYRALDGKDNSLSPVDWTRRETAARLFVPSLAALAVEEGKRAVPDRRLPFDPFTGALQIRPGRVAVRLVSITRNSAEVVARFTVAGTPRAVNFRLQDGAAGWRIADIWWGTDRRATFSRLLR